MSGGWWMRGTTLEACNCEPICPCRRIDGVPGDEPGSPWTWVLHVDDRATDAQRGAIADVFTGRLGGTPLEQFPWAYKPSELVAVVPSRIAVDHTPGRGWFRAGESVTVRIRGAYETGSTVTCVIPGHDRAGREVVAEELVSRGEPAAFDLTGVCGFESSFEYRAGA